jgi:sensor histidine kinase YesM
VLYTLTGIITLICILFAVRFSRQISIPIHELVVRAAKVSKGDLNIDKVEIRTNYELNTLVDSFNYMIIQIKRLISSIEEKAQVENRLKEQEIKNLEISNLLNESEIKFLQSQINPHFLFNTINTIIALTDVGNTSQIREMLESMARILRYNLKKLDMLVTLGDEYRVVKDFIYIQKMRFGDRIKYEMKIDKSVLSYKVPSMILQPFVENAFIHGIERSEQGGEVAVKAWCEEDKLCIRISDTGRGMSEEQITKLLEKPDNGDNSSLGGYAIYNVNERLKLIYGDAFTLKIDSLEGIGTKVDITIPCGQDG